MMIDIPDPFQDVSGQLLLSVVFLAPCGFYVFPTAGSIFGDSLIDLPYPGPASFFPFFARIRSFAS